MAMSGNKFVLDTSAYSAFNRGDARLCSFINPDHLIMVSLIVLGELRAGFAMGNRKEDNVMLLQRFLDSPNVDLLGITDKTSQIYSEIYAGLRKIGRPIGTNDMWIAATCVENDLDLLTLDADFKNIIGLKIVNL